MKNKPAKSLLRPILALLLLCFTIFCVADGIHALATPFTALGALLRRMSLSGTAGNIAALVLYALISLLPVLCKLAGRWQKEDCLLPVCSAILFYVLYYMVNPTLRPMLLQNNVGDLILSGVIYSVLLGWAVIRLLRRCDTLCSADLLGTLRRLLTALAALFLPALAVQLSSCRTDIADLYAGNTAPGTELSATVAFFWLSFAAAALEYLLTALLLLLAADLVRKLRKDPYSDDCTIAAQRVAAWCRRSLVAVTLTSLALPIAQILFASQLRNIAVSFHIPLTGMIVSFALLALSRLLCQTRELKEDNDLFI